MFGDVTSEKSKSSSNKKLDTLFEENNDLPICQSTTNDTITQNESNIIQNNDYIKKVSDILCESKRKKALFYLTKNREVIPNLAEILLNTPGVITLFLNEIVSSYGYINDTTTSKDQLCNCYNVLSLLQIIASNKEAKTKFVDCKFYFNFF